MNLINANLILAPTRLNRPLPTLYTRRFHSFTVQLSNVPDDVTSVSFRIFTVGGGAYFDTPCGRRPDGSALVYLIGTCFPDSGSTRYEIHGFDSHGNSTALGMGYVLVEEFSTSGDPIDPDEDVTLERIKDANGTWHTIKAVPDGAGGYTTIIADSGDNDDE